MLLQEKEQIFTIQVDLGVSLMTGDALRQPIRFNGTDRKDMIRVIETLKRDKDSRTERELKLLL